MEENIDSSIKKTEKIDFVVSKANEALRDFVEDMSHLASRGDIGEQQKRGQTSVIGLVLYDKLPQLMDTKEISKVIAVSPSTVKSWVEKKLLSPSQEETRPVMIGAGFTARASGEAPSPMVFDKDQIMTVLLLAAHKNIPEFSKTDIEKVLEDPDWSCDPDNLNWICYFLSSNLIVWGW